MNTLISEPGCEPVLCSIASELRDERAVRDVQDLLRWIKVPPGHTMQDLVLVGHSSATNERALRMGNVLIATTTLGLFEEVGHAIRKTRIERVYLAGCETGSNGETVAEMERVVTAAARRSVSVFGACNAVGLEHFDENGLVQGRLGDFRRGVACTSGLQEIPLSAAALPTEVVLRSENLPLTTIFRLLRRREMAGGNWRIVSEAARGLAAYLEEYSAKGVPLLLEPDLEIASSVRQGGVVRRYFLRDYSYLVTPTRVARAWRYTKVKNECRAELLAHLKGLTDQ